MTATLDAKTARRAALEAAGLQSPSPFGAGLEGSALAVEHLGSVQLDTISVVERAHHHILHSRVPRYAPGFPSRLETNGRRIFEYWSHAAAWLPIGDYRYCLPRMERIRERGHEWFHAEAGAVAFVRDRIRAEGPLLARDFEEGAKGRKGWWDWRPTKVALEYLFHSGELMAVTREGFQKRYDLAERALPSGLDLRRPGGEEMAAWHLDTAARTLGVFAREDVAYLRRDGLDGIDAELARRVEEGRLLALRVESLPAGAKGARRTWYASPEALEAAARGAVGAARVLVLSPFDPLVINRRRLARLFGLELSMECYTPAHKRRFGYFALPLFLASATSGAEAIGLLDAKAERAESTLVLRRLDLRADCGARRGTVAAALAAGLRRYARFNGCESLELERLECGDARLAGLVVERLGDKTAG